MSDFGAAKLLTPPHNYAVVQLPDRNYPGVVFQGDSLSCLFNSLQRVHADIQNPESRDEAIEVLGYVCDDIRLVLEDYEMVLGKTGIKLPYFKPGTTEKP